MRQLTPPFSVFMYWRHSILFVNIRLHFLPELSLASAYQAWWLYPVCLCFLLGWQANYFLGLADLVEGGELQGIMVHQAKSDQVRVGKSVRRGDH